MASSSSGVNRANSSTGSALAKPCKGNRLSVEHSCEPNKAKLPSHLVKRRQLQVGLAQDLLLNELGKCMTRCLAWHKARPNCGWLHTKRT